jgi:hypothetical protein
VSYLPKPRTSEYLVREIDRNLFCQFAWTRGLRVRFVALRLLPCRAALP